MPDIKVTVYSVANAEEAVALLRRLTTAPEPEPPPLDPAQTFRLLAAWYALCDAIVPVLAMQALFFDGRNLNVPPGPGFTPPAWLVHGRLQTLALAYPHANVEWATYIGGSYQFRRGAGVRWAKAVREYLKLPREA